MTAISQGRIVVRMVLMLLLAAMAFAARRLFRFSSN